MRKISRMCKGAHLSNSPHFTPNLLVSFYLELRRFANGAPLPLRLCFAKHKREQLAYDMSI